MFINFIGVKKEVLHTFLDVANALELEVRGILPLGLVLSKINSDLSSMFVLPETDANVVVFSELTGVTFAEKLGSKVSLKELEELFWKLSVYNNKHSELNIYTYKKYEHSFDPQKVLTLNGEGIEDGYEEICLANKAADDNIALLDSQVNLLNILPIPETVKAKRAPVVVLASIASLILISGILLQLTIGFNNIVGKIHAPGNNQNVLAGQNQGQTQNTPTSSPSATETPKKEIKRTDLKIRVENGNGIAGSAGKLKTYLEGFGYNVVSIGNSDKTDYQKTRVNLPAEFTDYETLLTNDLKTNYSVEINNADTKSADYDVLIIAGLN